MTEENPNKIDMTKHRDKFQWQSLLTAVRDNIGQTLTSREQAYYIDEIQYKIDGKRHSRVEILKDIQEGSAEIKQGEMG